MILQIVKVPDKVLTTPVKQVEKITPKIRKLIDDMSETLIAQIEPEGVGLAAPQVGESLALFITRPDAKAPVKAYINPEIVKIETMAKEKSKKNKTTLEGCLSVDRVWSPVDRPQKVLLSYQDIKGSVHEEWFERFDAVIIQHEMDHLKGVLFTQRAIEQNKPIFEEIDGELEEVQF